MTGSGSGGPESREEKRLNEDLVVFMRKRSDVDASHYAPSLKTYVTLQQNYEQLLIKFARRRRAAFARQKGEHPHDKASDKKQESDLKGKVKVPLSGEHNVSENERKRRVIGEKNGGVRSRSRSEEQFDASCRRRRRRRRRSCRRRRRSCGRRRRRSRRRRRRSRRRRRRSCRRRRSRSRRRRQCGQCRHRRRRRRCF